MGPDKSQTGKSPAAGVRNNAQGLADAVPRSTMEMPTTLNFFSSPTNMMQLALYGAAVVVALLALQQILRGALMLAVLAGAAALLGYSWSNLEIDLSRYTSLSQLTTQFPQLAPYIQQALSDQHIVRWEYQALQDLANELHPRVPPPPQDTSPPAAP